MIGSGLIKLAKEHGMKVSHGVAYGDLRGYACTMCEGSGWKRLVVATRFSGFDAQAAVNEELKSCNFSRDFRVLNLTFTEKAIVITFQDTIGTMGKIRGFIDWFFPILDKHSAAGIHVCSECGQELAGSGSWKLIGGIAYPMHHSCADKVRGEIDQEMDERKQTDSGSYVSGFFGALAGTVVGAVLWAVVLSFGYVASIVGFVIGWLADKGYQLCRGRQGRGKVAILIIMTVLGVLLGNVGADVMAIVELMGAGELSGITYGDIPLLLVLMLWDSEYLRATLINVGLGLLFAFLGTYNILKRTKNQVSGPKVVDLE